MNKDISLTALMPLILQAGTIITEGFASPLQTQWKEDRTPVTNADKKVNDLVLQFFEKNFPFMSVIAEEGSNAKDSEWVVFCDPIDGTIPYATGLPISTFCLSITRNGISEIGIIYEPFSNRLYSAQKGKGSALNFKKIQVSERKKLDSQTHASVIWWKGSISFQRTYEKLQSSGVKWMNLGTIGIVGGLIASGAFDISLFPGNALWETAAMSLIVEEAGGKCTDLSGEKILFNQENHGRMNGHLITNGWLHDEVLNLL